MAFSKNPMEQYRKVQNLYSDEDKNSSARFDKLTETTILRSEETPKEKKPAKNLQRVAQFVLLLGPEEGAQVLKHLQEDEIEIICREMAQIKGVSGAEAQEIFQEFGVRRELAEDGLQGGPEMAREILQQALGEDKSQEILDRVLPPELPDPFSFLEPVELPQMLHLLENESELSLGVILAHLPAKKAAEVLNTMEPPKAAAMVQRLSKMQQVNPDVLSRIAETIKERLDKQRIKEEESIDGKQALADILRHMGREQEQQILDDLGTQDQDLEEELKERIFTLDRVIYLRPKDLSDALKNYSDRDIAMLLRAKKESFKEFILSSFSQRRQQLINEEDILLGRVLRTDAEELTNRFISSIRNKVETGEYQLFEEDEEYI